jgi:transglutaminase-like putative cysteine protease
MRVLIQHRSAYAFPSPAALGPHTVRLRPAGHARATVEHYRLGVQGEAGAPLEHRLLWSLDAHGNHVARATFPRTVRARALELVVELALELTPFNPFDFFLDPGARALPVAYPPGTAAELAPFLRQDDPAYALGPRALDLLATLPSAGDAVGAVVEINQRVRAAIAYVIREEPGVWTPEETLAAGRGSCRDSAVLLVAALRSRGLAARFVSGYLVQLTDEGMIPDEPRGVSRDVVDLHAWAEVFLTGAGWVGLDATSGLLCGEGHIPLACTARPSAAAPVEGTSDRPAVSVSFEMKVGRLGHEPRPTAPFTEETWEALVAAGDHVDASLAGAGLTLTVGGEPTFTSRLYPNEPEWNGAALGPTKWSQGLALTEALRARLAPGGVVLHGFGKQYPGESLPRWSLSVVSRADGAAIEAGPRGEPSGLPRSRTRSGSRGRSPSGWASSLRSVSRPSKTPGTSSLKSRASRSASIPTAPACAIRRPAGSWRARSIAASDVAVGAVLPLAPATSGGWVGGAWKLRRERLYLIPGDSPIGLRLPLDSIEGGPHPPTRRGGPRGPARSAARRRHRGGAPTKEARRAGGAAAPREPQGSAPRCASSRATADCSCSCRRQQAPRASSTWCPRSARAAGGSASPSSSRAIRRQAVAPARPVLGHARPRRDRGQPAPVRDAAATICGDGGGLRRPRCGVGLSPSATSSTAGKRAAGGGHHITLGGPSPLASPFLRARRCSPAC